MSGKYAVIWVLVINCALGVYGQQCGDCMVVSDCPAAARLLKINDKISQQHLRNAFCKFVKLIPYVCCSKLPSGSYSLDQHPNLSLLPENCGSLEGDRIVGGTEAGLYQYPWMALISYKTRDGLKFLCGGTVINKRYILTAAHCIKGEKLAGVRIGEHDVTTKTDCQLSDKGVICESHLQDIAIDQEIIHPNYEGKPRVMNDIGLLRLASDIDFTPKNAKPVCLPVTAALRNKDLSGENATVAGWGFTENNYVSPVLLGVLIPIYPGPTCRALYNRGQSEDTILNKLCAGQNGKDSCQGDSGGPLKVIDFHRGFKRYIQYGIVSYGPRQCGSDYPGVYTEVSKYMDWILDNIKA